MSVSHGIGCAARMARCPVRDGAPTERRRRDLNPRTRLTPVNRLAGGPFRPLRHLSAEHRSLWCGGVAERSNAAVLKTVVRRKADRGFKSHPLRFLSLLSGISGSSAPRGLIRSEPLLGGPDCNTTVTAASQVGPAGRPCRRARGRRRAGPRPRPRCRHEVAVAVHRDGNGGVAHINAERLRADARRDHHRGERVAPLVQPERLARCQVRSPLKPSRAGFQG